MSDALFDTAQKSSVTAFKPGFRMLIGESSYKNREQARDFRQLTYTCMETQATRNPETIGFPKGPCKLGIMANHRFPTCWDGVNLDTPNHRDHVTYPETGTFESGGKCPSTHPVKIPQILLETVWDTSAFNKKEDWPADGSQPFVWSSGDSTGFSSHADYVFGWKDDSLQKAMDAHTYVSAPMLKTQSIAQQNKCVARDMVKENFDGCKSCPGLATCGIAADIWCNRVEGASWWKSCVLRRRHNETLVFWLAQNLLCVLFLVMASISLQHVLALSIYHFIMHFSVVTPTAVLSLLKKSTMQFFELRKNSK
jgi:hypothetical protein